MTSSCASVRRARPLLGTYVEVTACGADSAGLHRAIDLAFAAIATVHTLMSFQEPGSELSRFNRLGPAIGASLHPWTAAVLAAAGDFRQRSQGAFDAAVGAEGRIDLSGIAKGFAVDRAVEALRTAGVVQGIVNAGGDLAVFGEDGVDVAVRDPSDPSCLAGVVTLRNEALASSGRAIDPRTGRHVEAIAGASVRAPSCMIADALTKVVGVMGEAAVPVLHHYGASALLFREGSAVRLAA
ncbi:MAG: FAD:protein FMN transferase [Reyranellales bacterium]